MRKRVSEQKGRFLSKILNFLLFLQELRAALPPATRITAAADVQPWVDAGGRPMVDASGFADVLDWIMIMNYDTWGCKSSYMRLTLAR